jgi:hypothetical protein
MSRRRFKLHYTTKIAIGFVLVLAVWFGWQRVYGRIALGDARFPPIPPGEVNLIGVDTRAGYYVIVANRVAQLVLGQQPGFTVPEDASRAGEETGEKKRVPLRDMLRSLQGDAAALGRFVMALNRLNEAELPAVPVVWKAEEIRKALDGDQTLRQKLAHDLNVELDGRPLGYVNERAVSDGIVIDSPVELEVRPLSSSGEREPAGHRLVARIQEPFKSRLAFDVYERYKEKDATRTMIAGYYREEATEALKVAGSRENVAEMLRSRVDSQRLRSFAEAPERVLNSITVILNERHFAGASSRRYESPTGGELFDLTMDLTDEGRRRLWRYSQGRVGTQLLLVCRGVAVAAPRINHELSQSVVTITQLADEQLVEDTMMAIGELTGEIKS